MCQFKIGSAATLGWVSRRCVVPHQKRPAGEACGGGGGRNIFIHTVEMVPQNTWALPGHWSGSLPEGAHCWQQLVHRWVCKGTPLRIQHISRVTLAACITCCLRQKILGVTMGTRFCLSRACEDAVHNEPGVIGAAAWGWERENSSSLSSTPALIKCSKIV